VKEDGTLAENIQDYEYEEKAGVHGMVFDPTESYLYSADMGANKLWTHEKDSRSGKVKLVGSIEAPGAGDHPRWVEIHKSGKHLYLLMEAGNRLAEYKIDQETHLPEFTGKIFPLFPEGWPTLQESKGTMADKSQN
jgi:carboxy-cis,cis-muconate cyclase